MKDYCKTCGMEFEPEQEILKFKGNLFCDETCLLDILTPEIEKVSFSPKV